MNNPFYQQDILSVDQFNKVRLTFIMTMAKKMQKLVETKGGSDFLHGKMMTALFYEPSSRTFGSFIASMQRLGGGVIPLQGMTYSSVAKGETLTDTVRTFSSYSDVVVIRHPEVGSARLAAEASEKPIINAGDGVGEHPTQALLDFYTISHHFNHIKNLTITMVGDLLNGRTIHSLSKLLSLYSPITINLVSPEILKLPQAIQSKLKERKVKLYETQHLDEVIEKTDVLYVTRVQKERFTDLGIYEKVKHYYIITPDVLKKAKKDMIVMHPLPRVGEISMEVDLDKRAVYLTEQMVGGMYMRMALLALILKKSI